MRGTLQALIAAFVFALLFASASDKLGAKQPNVLFIFADDLCFEALGAYGHPIVKTPNLDRLAASGTMFSHCYNPGSWSGAVCVASRTMLNTGRYLWKAHGVYGKSEQERRAGRFWSEHLKKAGYETYFTGKWHVRAKAELAFDVASHVRPGMPNQTKEGYNRPLPGKPDPWSPYDPKFGGFWKGGRHWSEIVADDGVQYIERAAKRENPFFMYLAFNAPHDPRQAPKEFVDMYPLDKVDVPKNYLDEYPYKDAIGCGKRLRDEKLGPFPRTHHAVKVHRQEYYAIITHMDVQIGRMLDALEKSGKKDSTYIFFSADHGLGVGHHGLFGKQNLYDHSVRVPFLVAGPGVPKGHKIGAKIYLQDIVPTTLALAGVEKPDHVEFHSLLPLISGKEKRSVYDSRGVYGAYLQLQRSIILDDKKLILYPEIARARLYDLAKDPEEMNDLSTDVRSGPVMKKLFAQLLVLQKDMGDTLDLKTPFTSLAE